MHFRVMQLLSNPGYEFIASGIAEVVHDCRDRIHYPYNYAIELLIHFQLLRLDQMTSRYPGNSIMRGWMRLGSGDLAGPTILK